MTITRVSQAPLLSMFAWSQSSSECCTQSSKSARYRQVWPSFSFVKRLRSGNLELPCEMRRPQFDVEWRQVEDEADRAGTLATYGLNLESFNSVSWKKDSCDGRQFCCVPQRSGCFSTDLHLRSNSCWTAPIVISIYCNQAISFTAPIFSARRLIFAVIRKSVSLDMEASKACSKTWVMKKSMKDLYLTCGSCSPLSISPVCNATRRRSHKGERRHGLSASFHRTSSRVCL